MRRHLAGGRAAAVLGMLLGGLAPAPSADAQSRAWRRLDLDITGDGQPEIFVSRAFAGAPGGDTFEVLAPQADGSLRPWGRLLFDPARGFRVDASRRRVFVLGQPAEAQATLSVYALEAGLRRLDRRLLRTDETEGAFARETRALEAYWGGARKVQTRATPVRKGEPVWRDLASGRAVAGLRRLDGGGYTKASR